MPDENLDDYWHHFIEEHPELDNEMRKAILFLKKDGLNKDKLTEQERIDLFNSIQSTILKEKKRKKTMVIRYMSIASAIIALTILGITLFTPSSDDETVLEEGFIVGELLNNEDIQLITNGEAFLFQNDVEVMLDEEGNAEIIQTDNESSKVQIAKDRLNSLIIPYGKRSHLKLSDGSSIWLNSGSALEFPAQFSGDKREIRLISGEMFIEVAPDITKPFHVQTADFNVQVYGTAFNLSVYSDSPHSVVLVEGKIAVKSTNSEELFIHVNEMATLSDDGSFDVRKVDTDQYTSWRKGYLKFDKTPMTEVLKQVGRYYNLSFDFEQNVNLQKRTCTGKIFLSEELDNVMTTVGILTKSKFSKENNKIYITSTSD